MRIQDSLASFAGAGIQQADHPGFHLGRGAGGAWKFGAASRWWLHHALLDLSKSIRNLGGQLLLLRGKAEEVIPRLARELGAKQVYYGRTYDPAESKPKRRSKMLSIKRVSVLSPSTPVFCRNPGKPRTDPANLFRYSLPTGVNPARSFTANLFTTIRPSYSLPLCLPQRRIPMTWISSSPPLAPQALPTLGGDGGSRSSNDKAYRGRGDPFLLNPPQPPSRRRNLPTFALPRLGFGQPSSNLPCRAFGRK